jgi:hypothetical protein
MLPPVGMVNPSSSYDHPLLYGVEREISIALWGKCANSKITALERPQFEPQRVPLRAVAAEPQRKR